MDTTDITPDYLGLIINAFDKIDRLQIEREKLDAEIMKQEQFISATANFLPDDQRDLVVRRMALGQSLQNVRESSLTDAIRAILRQESGNWLTTTNVRDRLMNLGFDFTAYSTNPLASISTTLRRMKPEEVETRTVDGAVGAYRWKQASEPNYAALLKAAAKAMEKK